MKIFILFVKLLNECNKKLFGLMLHQCLAEFTYINS